MSAFDTAFAITVGHEGKYDASPKDTGNWTGGIQGIGQLKGTAWGISAAAYPTLDIANLTLSEAKAIYRRDYWDKMRCDELPPALAVLVFDAAVNNGPGKAAFWLQTAVGALPDGKIGPATLRAAAAATGDAPLIEFQAQRTNFMAGLTGWRTFGLGWARRLCALPYQIPAAGQAAQQGDAS